MDIAERPLRKWLHRFNKHGPSGLCDAPRSGQPPKVNIKQMEKFKRRIRQGVTERDNVCTQIERFWSDIRSGGKLLSQLRYGEA